MSTQMEWKSREELEALPLEVTKRQLGCKDTRQVTVRRLHPTGSGPNWEPDKFEPPLAPIAEQEAREAIAGLTGSYALVD
jgi:hypothetical protein